MDGKRSLIERIANERVAILFSMAERYAASEPELSASYISILERIIKHYHLKIDSRMKSRICKKCGIVLIPGLNCSVRIRSSSGMIAHMCSTCGSCTRFAYK